MIELAAGNRNQVCMVVPRKKKSSCANTNTTALAEKTNSGPNQSTNDPWARVPRRLVIFSIAAVAFV